MDLALHNAHVTAGAAGAGERSVRFVLVDSNERPITSATVSGVTLKGYMRLSWMERDGTNSNAAPTNTPTEVDITNCAGEWKLVLETAEITHGELILHINDGDGNTFKYQYILIKYIGGTTNTGGLLHRGSS